MSSEPLANRNVRGSWDRAAATCGQVGPPYFAHFGARLADLAGVQPGWRVLDVATGRGSALFPASERVGPQGLVVGADYSFGMAQATAAVAPANAALLQMDAQELAFADGTFDAVLCGFAIFFFPEPSRALAEFRRVLRAGGRLTLSVWDKGDARWDWLAEMRRRAALPSFPRTIDARGPAPLLAAAGFGGVKVVAEEQEFVYADADQWWATTWSHGGRAELENVSAEAQEAARQFAYERLREQAGPEGIPQIFRVLFFLAQRGD